MTSSYPSSSSERDQWQLEGKIPDAVKIGGKYYSVTGAAPLGNLMAFGAQLYHNTQDPEQTAGGAVASTIAGTGKALTDMSFLAGTKGAVEATANVATAGKFFRNQAASGVPSVIGAAAKAADPAIRDPKTVGEAVTARIPGASKTLPARVDQFGKEVTQDGGTGERIFNAFVNPFYTRTDKTTNDPVLAEMQRVGATIGRVKKRGAEGDEEFRERQERVGLKVRQAVERAIGMAAYSGNDDAEKREMIEDAVRRVRSRDTRTNRERP